MIRFTVHRRAAALDILQMKDLAERAGVHYVTISGIWKNASKRVDLETLDKLCKALDCEPGDLFERVPDPPEQQARA